MNHLDLIIWPIWEGRDLWRWGMMAFGFSWVAYGLFRKHMTWPDYGTWHGYWFGKTTKKRSQVVYKRTFFVLLGIAMISFAFTYDLER